VRGFGLRSCVISEGLETAVEGGRLGRRNQSSRLKDDSKGDGLGGGSLWDSNVENVHKRNRNHSDGKEASSSALDWLTNKKD
jgi:hypothetical protein